MSASALDTPRNDRRRYTSATRIGARTMPAAKSAYMAATWSIVRSPSGSYQVCAEPQSVTIANAVGNGVADDKLVYTYVPELIRYFLGEEPILPNVDTWRLEEPEALAEVLDRLDELVVKPVDGSGGKGLVIGPDASKAVLAELRARLLADPRGWIAQPVVQLSTIPTLVDDGMRPRHADLRPFAVNDGNDVLVLPGGLTRVALPEGELVVNSSQGGGSKDTWVLDGTPITNTTPLGMPRATGAGTVVADQAAPAAAAKQHRRHPPEASPQDEEAPVRQQQQQQQQARMPRHPLAYPTELPKFVQKWATREEAPAATTELPESVQKWATRDRAAEVSGC